ncbi:SWIM zinc finger family protein [Nonomuraea pusilla]|uniref:SWIM zinc finger family protein n=1 Tax=Nonomuraea pusilla TaxID=46177 RepID=UPI00332B589A
MIERWSREQVLALAPDAPSRRAAQVVAAPGRWAAYGLRAGHGAAGGVVFGECLGGSSGRYQACVHLGGPAYRCTCPGRESPCEHVLGLLLLWSSGGVPEAPYAPEWAEKPPAPAAAPEAPGGPGEPVTGQSPGLRRDAATGAGVPSEQARAPRPAISEPARAPRPATAEPGGPRGRAGGESARHGRVAAGLAELERWLADQVRQGLASTAEHDWDGLAKRLIDAQAPGVAGVVSRLAGVRSEPGWPERLLEEYALLDLLAVAYRRRAELPAPLARTVLSRCGFPVAREEVLAGPVVRDRWHVIGRRDEEQDRLASRRVWLRGRQTGRPALVLSFAAPGQQLDASLVTGTTVDAGLAFYPGAAPLRALVATRHEPAEEPGDTAPASAEGPPPGLGVDAALDEVAEALAGDPWTDSWPLVLSGVVPERAALGGLPLHPRARDPWRLIAVSGGRPLTVAAEWTPLGLRPLTTWDDDGTAVTL